MLDPFNWLFGKKSSDAKPPATFYDISRVLPSTTIQAPMPPVKTPQQVAFETRRDILYPMGQIDMTKSPLDTFLQAQQITRDLAKIPVEESGCVIIRDHVGTKYLSSINQMLERLKPNLLIYSLGVEQASAKPEYTVRVNFYHESNRLSPCGNMTFRIRTPDMALLDFIGDFTPPVETSPRILCHELTTRSQRYDPESTYKWFVDLLVVYLGNLAGMEGTASC
jgi:hypothetical protein